MNISKSVSIALAAIALGFSGCHSVELQAHGNQDPKPVINDWYIRTWGHYWTCPQKILDQWSQSKVGGSVSTQGIFRIEVESNYLFDLASACTLSLIAPINIKCWMQDDGKTNVLPADIQHERPRR